jgi:hypothetical protein
VQNKGVFGRDDIARAFAVFRKVARAGTYVDEFKDKIRR